MFSLILAHTNDYISKEKFVAAGAGLQFAFGLGAMSGPFICSVFMDIVGPNGFFIFLFFFHSIIGVFGIYRMKIRKTVVIQTLNLLQCLKQLLQQELN